MRAVSFETFSYVGANGKLAGFHNSDPTRIPILMVEFPSYTGPPVTPGMASNGQSRWIPIAAVTMRCENKCCERTGLPIAIAKADSFHCMQGLTVGNDQPIHRLLSCWTTHGERLFPGIKYVGDSRVRELDNLAFVQPVSQQDLASVGRDKRWQRQLNEVRKIEAKAFRLREEMAAHGQGTKQDFAHLI